MLPRYKIFSRKPDKRKADKLREASLASEAAMKELKVDLDNEISALRAEVKNLKEQRRELYGDIQAIMTTESRDGYTKPSTQRTPFNTIPPELPEATPPDNTPKTAWRMVDRKARALENSGLTPQPLRSTAPSMPKPSDKPPQAAPLRVPKSPFPPPRHTSWATWVPDPSFAPSPAPVESNLVVPEHDSPGLFGPRSPRSLLS